MAKSSMARRLWMAKAALADTGDAITRAMAKYSAARTLLIRNFKPVRGRIFTTTAGDVQALSAADPIGMVFDDSGDSNTSTQTTAGARGTLQIVGNRFVWRGDGTDDSLLTPLMGAVATTAIVACEFNAVSDVVLGKNEAVGSGRFILQTDANGRLGAGVASQDATTIFGGSDIRDIPGVAALRGDGTTVSLWWKPFGTAITKIYEAAQSGAIGSTTPFRIGRNNNNGTPGTAFDGDIYGLFAIETALTDAEVSAIATLFSQGA